MVKIKIKYDKVTENNARLYLKLKKGLVVRLDGGLKAWHGAYEWYHLVVVMKEKQKKKRKRKGWRRSLSGEKRTKGEKQKTFKDKEKTKTKGIIFCFKKRHKKRKKIGVFSWSEERKKGRIYVLKMYK